MTDVDYFPTRLTELARAQATAKELEERYAGPLMEVKTAKNFAASLEKSLRDDALFYFKETGDMTLDSDQKDLRISVVERDHYHVTDFVALAAAHPEVIQVKETDLKTLFAKEKPDYIGKQRVGLPTVFMSAHLGHRIIIEDMDRDSLSSPLS